MSITPQRCRKHKHLKAWSLEVVKISLFLTSRQHQLVPTLSTLPLFPAIFFSKGNTFDDFCIIVYKFHSTGVQVCSSGLKNGFKFVMSSPAACYRSSCRSVCFKKKTTGGGKERTLYFLHSSFISKTTTTGSLHLQLQKQIDSNDFQLLLGDSVAELHFLLTCSFSV